MDLKQGECWFVLQANAISIPVPCPSFNSSLFLSSIDSFLLYFFITSPRASNPCLHQQLTRLLNHPINKQTNKPTNQQTTTTTTAQCLLSAALHLNSLLALVLLPRVLSLRCPNKQSWWPHDQTSSILAGLVRLRHGRKHNQRISWLFRFASLTLITFSTLELQPFMRILNRKKVNAYRASSVFSSVWRSDLQQLRPSMIIFCSILQSIVQVTVFLLSATAPCDPIVRSMPTIQSTTSQSSHQSASPPNHISRSDTKFLGIRAVHSPILPPASVVDVMTWLLAFPVAVLKHCNTKFCFLSDRIDLAWTLAVFYRVLSFFVCLSVSVYRGGCIIDNIPNILYNELNQFLLLIESHYTIEY